MFFCFGIWGVVERGWGWMLGVVGGIVGERWGGSEGGVRELGRGGWGRGGEASVTEGV